MLEVMKDITAAKFENWKEAIIKSSDGAHVVDSSIELSDIMSRNIITNAFGEDINDELFEL